MIPLPVSTDPTNPSLQQGFRLNENFILRTEYFGALLLSRTEGTRYVLGRAEGFFLWALELGLSVDNAVRLVQKFEHSFSPDNLLGRLYARRLITQGPSTVSPSPDHERMFQSLIAETSARDYLSAPLNLSLYPFMACQMRCRFCYVTSEKWRGSHRPAKDWIRLVEEAHLMGIPTVSVLGGDPSLYPGIVPLIQSFDTVGVTGVITTNGCTVSGELLDAMISSERLIVSASLQSVDDDYHRRMTGRPVVETKNFIERLSAHGKAFTINAVYIRQTDDQIKDLIDYAIANGASKLSLAVFVDIAQTGMVPPTFAEYRRIYELGMSHVARSRSTLVFQVEGCQLYTAYPDIRGNPATTEFERLVYGCEAGNGRFEIMHDGSALPCALFEESSWSAGNVFEATLRSVWEHSAVLQRIRTYKNKDATCNGCTFGGFCNGGCPALNEARYGSIEDKADDRCAIRRPEGLTFIPLAQVRRTRPSMTSNIRFGPPPTP